MRITNMYTRGLLLPPTSLYHTGAVLLRRGRTERNVRRGRLSVEERQ